MSEAHEPPEGIDVLVRPAPAPSWHDRLARLADATGTTPLRIGAGALCAVVALAAGYWITRPAATPTEVSLPFVTTSVGTGSAAAGATTSSAPSEVVVYVAGSVIRVGVVRLPIGSRVVDAVDAAGGLAPDADPARINLAALLVDGQRVYVPAIGEADPPPGGTEDPPGGGGGRPTGPVDLNTADAAALDALPGIGPATAKAILDHRARIGRFTSIEQLLDVRGIGEAKLEELRPLVTV